MAAAALATSASAGLGAATAIGLAVNRLLEAAVGDEDGEMLDGFPRSRWLLSVGIQACVFPSLVWLSFNASSWAGLTLSQWLASAASQLPGYGRWYVYALFGSQTRDMCPMPAATSMLMKVHHWVVVVACILSLLAPQGFGLFVAGTFVLELGSMMFNLRVLYPGSWIISAAYQAAMLVSNLAALAGGVLLLSMKEVPLWMRMLYFIADVGVCIGRQRHALKDAGLIGSRPKATADGPSGSTAPAGVATSARKRRGREARKPLALAALTLPLLLQRTTSPRRAAGATLPRPMPSAGVDRFSSSGRAAPALRLAPRPALLSFRR